MVDMSVSKLTSPTDVSKSFWGQRQLGQAREEIRRPRHAEQRTTVQQGPVQLIGIRRDPSDQHLVDGLR